MEVVIDFINDNLNSKLNVKILADLINVSPDYLSYLFKDFTGDSIIKYINKRRIRAAKAMLVEKNMKVREVTLALGYKDEFYFSRVFKKFEGISPVEFGG